MGTNNRRIATYDEEARREYLTGFRKRKAERRKNAETVRVEREKDERRQDRTAKRARLDELAGLRSKFVRDTPAASDEEDDEDDGVPRAGAGSKVERELTDDFSKKAFGADRVVVSTIIGGVGEDEEGEEVSDTEALLRELAAAHPAPARKPRSSTPHVAGAAGRAKSSSSKGKRKGGSSASNKKRHGLPNASGRKLKSGSGGKAARK